MSKLNKIITNQPVVLTEEEVNNLSETLSAVRTAGGGEGGHLYTGDNKYIGVDNGNYKIKFLDNAAEKLESISSKLDKTEAANTYLTSADAQTLYQTKEAMSDYAKKTEIPDSITDFADTSAVIYSYINPATADIQQQLNGKQNKLKFDLNDKGEISAIGTEYGTTTALAGANGITGDYYSASNPSGFINSTQVETQILEKHYLTEASGNARYIPIPEGLSDNQYYAYTTSSWKVIQGAGDVSGISTVAHDDTLTGNGNNENLGVDITKIQTKLTDAQIQNITDVTTLKTASAGWDAKVDQSDLNDYLTKTQYGTDSATFALRTQLDDYATKGYADNASANALSEAKSWVGLQGYLTSVPDTYALKTDIPTTVAELSDSGNYYQKTDTSSKTEITNALNTKVDKPIQQTGKLVYDGDNNEWVTLPAGTTIIVQGQGSVTANYNSQNSTYTVSLLASAENALAGVNDKIDTTAVAQTYQTKSDMTNYLTTSDAATTYQTKGDYATTSDISDMATQTWVGQQGFYTKSSADNDYAPKSITADVNTLTAASAGWNNKVDKPTSLVDKYLVLRTDTNGDVSGWYDLQAQSYSKSEADRTFVATANIDTTTLSGDGKSVSTKLGVKTDVIATIDYVSGNYLPTSGGTVSGQLEVHGGSNFDTQFIKLTREGNSCGARIGLGNDTTNGTLALKTFNSQGQNTVQVNIKHNTNNNELIQVQKGGSDVGFLIPAQIHQGSYTPTEADGILHIVLES